jgi:hypothetical protein
MRIQRALLAATAILLLLAGNVSQAKTKLEVEIGWEGVVRLGRWTPVAVTLTDPAMPNAAVEISAAHDPMFSMRVRQNVGALGPQPKTFVLYTPVNGYLGVNAGSVLSIVVRDADSGKLLADSNDEMSEKSVQQVDAQKLFVGVSGRRNSLLLLRSSVQSDRLATGFMPVEALPLAAQGYDALDLLLLNAADLTALTDEQQHAIVDWVRAGGKLLLWPGPDPVPRTGPLIDALPCRIGGAALVTLPPDVLKRLDLSRRFEKLASRELLPSDRATPVLLLNGKVTGYCCDLGLGAIVVSPINLGDLQTNASANLRKLWEPALSPALDTSRLNPPAAGSAYYNNFGPYEQRQGAAEQVITDLLGDVPGAGQFGFSYVAVTLIGLMVIVGPVDWFVLRALKRQAWTWVTTSGWIALVTLGALYIGHAFKSGDLHYRTYTLVDQAPDGVVARSTFAGLYSPLTADYTLETSPTGWWEPLAPARYGYGYANRTGSELRYAQTYRGNTPLPMRANVWSLRFQRGREIGAGPKLLDAELTVAPTSGGKRVSGILRNLTDRPLRNVRVILDGVETPVLDIVVPANGSTRFSDLASVDRKKAQNAAGEAYYDNYNPHLAAVPESERPSAAAAFLEAGRAKPLDRRLQSGNAAVVIAEQDGTAEVTLKESDGAFQRHFRVIRALFPLKPQ